jgi:hypothetical protein
MRSAGDGHQSNEIVPVTRAILANLDDEEVTFYVTPQFLGICIIGPRRHRSAIRLRNGGIFTTFAVAKN